MRTQVKETIYVEIPCTLYTCIRYECLKMKYWYIGEISFVLSVLVSSSLTVTKHTNQNLSVEIFLESDANPHSPITHSDVVIVFFDNTGLRLKGI